MDHIQEAFNDLRTLGIILDETLNDWLCLDLNRLHILGYCLTFNGYEPEFSLISDFHYMYNVNIYTYNFIPKESLRSFIMLNLKNTKLSP